ncbi:MAG: 1,4-alpha-glucan branching enzyme [Solirubrobacteraceae bacterium]|nr:1,4-alpha-glucan branching enzyme [Solirubrobacteraceae bacterium]
MTSAARDRGELALVLHTHMPYVEGFGTWPFGEEWLWEAMATSYLPLLDVLEREEAVVTLSLTPVLCDQLEAPGVAERFLAFLRDVRAETHRQDIEGSRAGAPELVAELEASARDYAWADERFEAIGRDLLGALAPHASWTSAATHAVLPLLATDAGVELQVASGIASHRRRCGAWGGGFWLPECGYAEWLGPLLVDLGIEAACVDLTDVFGDGMPLPAPLRRADGPVLVPIDRQIVELVWSDRGYPAHGSYRDYHHHTIHHHRPWANDGSPYDRGAARALVREHAREFVGQVRERLGEGGGTGRQPPLCVCALDTELLGHWWHEGVAWLEGVIEEAAAQGLALARLDDALARRDPVILEDPLPVTTWGTPRDLSTWDGPQVAEFAWRARAGELRTMAAGGRAVERAASELLALQASDWAFMVSRGLAGDYPVRRAAEHAAALDAALGAIGSSAPEPTLRNLAPDLARFALNR